MCLKKCKCQLYKCASGKKQTKYRPRIQCVRTFYFAANPQFCIRLWLAKKSMWILIIVATMLMFLVISFFFIRCQSLLGNVAFFFILSPSLLTSIAAGKALFLFLKFFSTSNPRLHTSNFESSLPSSVQCRCSRCSHCYTISTEACTKTQNTETERFKLMHCYSTLFQTSSKERKTKSQRKSDSNLLAWH